MWKDYIWNSATCTSEKGKYLASITDDDLVITCDEIIEETKTVPIKFSRNSSLTCVFNNNYGIIDGCYYSLLSNKTSRKTKTFITISSYKFQINKKYIIEMEINGKLKEIDIKNRTCYYFDEII